jgi:hypothetical protein
MDEPEGVIEQAVNPFEAVRIRVLEGIALDVAEEVQPLRVLQPVVGLRDGVFCGEAAQIRGVVPVDCIVSPVLMRGVVAGEDKPVAVFAL